MKEIKITLNTSEKATLQFKNEIIEEVNSKLLKVKQELSSIYGIPIEQIESRSLISDDENFGLPPISVSFYIFLNKNTNELLNPCFSTLSVAHFQNP